MTHLAYFPLSRWLVALARGWRFSNHECGWLGGTHGAWSVLLETDCLPTTEIG
jgi:hypothetical protein